MRRHELPAGAFVTWLREFVDRRHDGNLNEFAGAVGIDEAQLRRMLRARLVTLETVDRVMVHADEPHMLAILYPLEP